MNVGMHRVQRLKAHAQHHPRFSTLHITAFGDKDRELEVVLYFDDSQHAFRVEQMKLNVNHAQEQIDGTLDRIRQAVAAKTEEDGA